MYLTLKTLYTFKRSNPVNAVLPHFWNREEFAPKWVYFKRKEFVPLRKQILKYKYQHFMLEKKKKKKKKMQQVIFSYKCFN